MTNIANKTIQEIYELFKFFEFFYNKDIKNIIETNNYRIENIPYIKYIFALSIILLSSYLCDRIFTHWKNIFYKSNKYNTKKYNNFYILLISETFFYLIQLPNLITIFIGIIQFYYVSKYINIIVSLLCWIFAISSQITKYIDSKNNDEIINSKKFKKKDMFYRSDELYIDDDITINYNDKTPAYLKINNIKHIDDFNISECQKDDFDICFYDDKESTGEDISASFTKGDIIPPHRTITRPNTIIEGKIIKYVEPVLFEHQITQPIFLNKIRFIIDIISITTLGIIALFISASAMNINNNLNNTEKFKIILKHFFASMISGNVLIPSMKMTLLYNVYNLILGASFSNIKINSYDSLLKLDDINSAIFDKTGTITEEHLSVYNQYSFYNNSIFQKLKNLDWNKDEILFALTMANSESNLYENSNGQDFKVYGTSPEENKMLEYWYITKKVKLIFNPIKPSGHVSFKFPERTEKIFYIKNRNPYNFENGKISIITFFDEEKNKHDFIIRQHGTSRFLDNYIKEKKHSSDILSSLSDEDIVSLDWAYYISKNDKRRSISVAISIGDNKWELVSIYTFENPLRRKINDVMIFFRDKNIPCSILTGDSRETAEEIAKEAGFPEHIYNITCDNDILNLSNTVKNHKITISIDANLLNNILNESENTGEYLLNNNNIFKIIYKASKTTKEKVVMNTNNCLYTGDAKNDELAIKKAYVGISLKHGADTCKLYSSICISEPYDLIDLLESNGYKDMLLIGGQKIFKDVCFIGGVICGCLIVGIYKNNLEFVGNSLLYKDVWDPLPMLMISSIQYTTSVIGFASSNCYNSKTLLNSNLILGILAFINNIFGLVIGTVISLFLKNYLNIFYFDSAILHIINLIILFKHSIHKINSNKMFGNQKISNSSKIIGFGMNIIDSFLFRLILYFVFCVIF